MHRLEVRRRDAGVGHACERWLADFAYARVGFGGVLQKVHIVRRGDEVLHHETGGGKGHDPRSAVRSVVCHFPREGGTLAFQLKAELLELRRVELGYIGG